MGDTALHLSAWKGHVDCVRAIRASGHPADLRIKNAEGKTAVDACGEPETKVSFVRATFGRPTSV